MNTLEEEARLREEQVPVAAESLFDPPLFRVPAFVFATVLGFVALAMNIRLGIAAVSRFSPAYGCLWAVGCLLVTFWFSVTSHLEDIRATFLNESRLSGERSSVLSIALMADYRMTLGGLTAVYFVTALLQLVIWRLLLGRLL